MDLRRVAPCVAAFLLATGVVGAQAAPAQPEPGPKVGDVAPAFSLGGATRDGVLKTPVSLAQFKGQTVVIAFFPKARTTGCTAQMTTYRDQWASLFNGGKGIHVIAISMDADDDAVPTSPPTSPPSAAKKEKKEKRAAASKKKKGTGASGTAAITKGAGSSSALLGATPTPSSAAVLSDAAANEHEHEHEHDDDAAPAAAHLRDRAELSG